MRSSIGVVEAILAEIEKRRRGSRPGRVRGSIEDCLCSMYSHGNSSTKRTSVGGK
jgi:hypothetical protein